jgi:hypothetical protein
MTRPSLENARRMFPPVWVIYRHPKDFPRHWVVRVFYGETPSPVACLCGTIGEAREQVPRWSVKLAAHPDDDAVIFETWI